MKTAMTTWAVMSILRFLPAVTGVLLFPEKDKGRTEKLPLRLRSWTQGIRNLMEVKLCQLTASFGPKKCSSRATEQNTALQAELLSPESWKQLHWCPVIVSVRQRLETTLHGSDGSREGETSTVVLVAGQQLPGSHNPSVCRLRGDARKGTQADWWYTLLVLYLSRLLITHYLNVTRWINTSLRNQYGSGRRCCLPFRACTSWEKQGAVDPKGGLRCWAGWEAQRGQ